MKLAIISAIILIMLTGCLTKTSDTITGIQGLMLNEQDLNQLGMTKDETDCQIDEYQANEYSPVTQTGICGYTINSLDDTQVIVQLTGFANLEDRDGAYQYDSSHLYSIEGLISENDYGDFSRFRVNNEHDYGGQYNPPGVYYYHLWICKNKYIIHITSSGSKEAKDYIARIGQTILSKFEQNFEVHVTL